MNRHRKRYQQFANKGKYDHGVLYKMVRDLRSIVAKHRDEHPRTKVWKDLDEIAAEIDLAQKDWFSESQRRK